MYTFKSNELWCYCYRQKLMAYTYRKFENFISFPSVSDCSLYGGRALNIFAPKYTIPSFYPLP